MVTKRHHCWLKLDILTSRVIYSATLDEDWNLESRKMQWASDSVQICVQQANLLKNHDDTCTDQLRRLYLPGPAHRCGGDGGDHLQEEEEAEGEGEEV